MHPAFKVARYSLTILFSKRVKSTALPSSNLRQIGMPNH